MGELDQKGPAENLIKSLEQTYSDLREKHPERDEHWFLANTWLKKYGATDEAREKGEEWARFTAYRETYQFSILEPPASIRGLALHLVYKELGEPAVKDYESELFQILEPVLRSEQEGGFFDRYRERNPLTWEEIQEDKDSTYSLYWYFRGRELLPEPPEGDLDELDVIEQSLQDMMGQLKEEGDW